MIKIKCLQKLSAMWGEGELAHRDSGGYSDIVAWGILVVLLQYVDDNDHFPEMNVNIQSCRTESLSRKMTVLLKIIRQELTFLKDCLWD